MTSSAPARNPALRRAFAGVRAAARAVIVCVCAIVLLAAALPAHAASPQNSIVVARSAPAPHRHPCTGGLTPSPRCTISGVTIALPAHDGGRVAPPLTRAQPVIAARAAIQPQWRGLPPDRPPRA